MSKVAIFNIGQSGHVNPTLALTRELVRQGEQVIYYTASPYKTVVEATGAQFRATDTPDAPGLFSRITGGRGPSDMVAFSGLFDALAPDVSAERPDYVLYDSMSVWGRLLVQYLKVPAIRFNSTHAFSKATFTPVDIVLRKVPFLKVAVPLLQRSVNGITTRYHLEKRAVNDLFVQPEMLDLVFVPKKFQLAGDTFSDSYKFVGPSIERQEADADTFPFAALKAPVLYISLGTMINKRLDFYKNCLAAFKDSAWQVVMSVGSQIDITQLGEIPANFIVRPSVPQIKVLEHVSVFMTHGGMNSTMEALSFGIPLVVLPQMGEQEINAQRVDELGVGIHLQNSTRSSVDELRQAVEHVSQNPSYRDNAVAMQQVLRESGGYRQALSEILAFKAQHLSPV